MFEFNRDVFWKEVKARNAFKGTIKHETVAGTNAIFEAFVWAEENDKLDTQLLRSDLVLAAAICNVLANVRREVGIKMLPVFEGFKDTYEEAVRYVQRNFKYGRPEGPYNLSYPGIGQIQLTHWPNFKKMGDRLGIDLERQPWLAKKLMNSARIAVVGMSDGSFRRGHRLRVYSHADGPDAKAGREMVNGDKNYSMKGYGTIGNFIEQVADDLFECFKEAMKFPLDDWDEGDPILWDEDNSPDNDDETKGDKSMAFSVGKLLPLIFGGMGGLSSCTNLGAQTGTIASDSILTQLAAGGESSILMLGVGILMALVMNKGDNGNFADILKTLFAMDASATKDKTVGKDS